MRILFIGNSHTYFNDMPQTFCELWCDAFGEMPQVTMLAYSYRSLQWHSDEYFTLRFNLLYGGYDVCVIQQCAHPFPGYEETERGLESILRLCRAANTSPFLFMPWCEKSLPEKQEKITSALRRLAAKEHMETIPVGDVWQELQRRMLEVSLYWTDGEHASPAGDYLVAVTACMAISGRTDISPLGNARDFTLGASVDFDHPAVCEDIGKVRCAVTQELRDGVAASARAVLNGSCSPVPGCLPHTDLR